MEIGLTHGTLGAKHRFIFGKGTNLNVWTVPTADGMVTRELRNCVCVRVGAAAPAYGTNAAACPEHDLGTG